MGTLPDEAFSFQFAVAAEVEEQADLEAGCLKIVEELGVVFAGEQIEHFQHNDNLPKANEVGNVCAGKALPFVFDVDCLFDIEGNAACLQLDLHGFLIYIGEEAGAERTMHFYRGRCDGIGFVLQNRLGQNCRLGPLRAVYEGFHLR